MIDTPWGSFRRQHWNEHESLPPEFLAVKEYLLKVADERAALKREREVQDE